MADSSKAAHNTDDIQDSPSDQERLKDEVTYIDLPEVSDIPGQEHVTAPALGDLADTTVSSDDEEGLVNDDSDDDDYFAEGEKEDTIGIP